MLIQVRLDEVYEPILVEEIIKKDIIAHLASTEKFCTTYILEIEDSELTNFKNMKSADFVFVFENDEDTIAKFYNPGE